MVERFNGRWAEVLATTGFKSGEELSVTLKRHVYLFNQQIPQQALRIHPPIQALKSRQDSHPHLFNKLVRSRPERDMVL